MHELILQTVLIDKQERYDNDFLLFNLADCISVPEGKWLEYKCLVAGCLFQQPMP